MTRTQAVVLVLGLGLESQVLVNLAITGSASKDSLRRKIISKNDWFLV